jgi:predicted membrane protein
METINCKNNKPHKDNRSKVGIVFLIIGMVLLGNNFGMLPGLVAPHIFSWPMILIGIGLIMVATSKRNVGGVIMIAIGGLFLWNRISPLSPLQWEMAWPALFIVVGLVLITGYLSRPSKPKEKQVQPKRKKSKYDDIEFDIDKIEPIET